MKFNELSEEETQRKILTPEQKKYVEQIKELARRGKTVKEISFEIGGSPWHIRRIAKKHEIEIEYARSRARREKRIKSLEKLAEEGHTIKEIAEETGLGYSTVRNYAIKEGIKITREKGQYTRKKRQYEKNIKQIRELAEEGCTGKEIAKETDLAYGTVIAYAIRESIEIKKQALGRPRKPRLSDEELEKLVLETARRKTLVASDILKALNLPISPRSVKKILMEHDIYFSGKNMDREAYSYLELLPPVWLVNPEGVEQALIRNSGGDETYEANKAAILSAIQEHDCITIKQVHDLTQIPRESIEEVLILEDLGIEVPRRKRNPEIDKYIEQGLSLGVIGDQPDVKLTRERVRQYIASRGLGGFYKEKRRLVKFRDKEEKEAPIRAQQSLVNTLAGVIYKEASEIDEAHRLAAQYILGRKQTTKTGPKRSYNFETLRQVYQLHLEGLSMTEIARKTDLNYTSAVQRILRRVGLESNFSVGQYDRSYRNAINQKLS